MNSIDFHLFPYVNGIGFGPVTFVMYDCTMQYILASWNPVKWNTNIIT